PLRAAQMTDGDLRRQLEATTEEVLAQEVEHHSWARDTRAAMTIAHAGGSADRMIRVGSASSEERTKSELYEMAQEMGIEGRSAMTKDELAQAVAEQGGRA